MDAERNITPLQSLSNKVIESIIADPVISKAILEPIRYRPQDIDTITTLEQHKTLNELGYERYKDLASYIGRIIRDTDFYDSIYNEIDERYPEVMTAFDDKLAEQRKLVGEIAANIRPGQDKKTIETYSYRAYLLESLADYAIQQSLDQSADAEKEFPKVG